MEGGEGHEKERANVLGNLHLCDVQDVIDVLTY